ncbi:MAG: FAD-dependent oxidoreductase, partial [Sphingobacteriales bacterium]
MSNKTAIVVGAGIVGLATARALAVSGYRVTVIERNSRAVDASIRNFGMIWPIGQPDGYLYDTAVRSKEIWLEICAAAGIWHDRVGSLHLAYHRDEWDVLHELASVYAHRGYQLLDADAVALRSKSALQNGLLGGLYSDEEMIVNPRLAIPAVATWLAEKHGVVFIWNTAATSIAHPNLRAGEQIFTADEIYVCSGADFETLFPAEFAAREITKCKLQMLKLATRPGNNRLGAAL